MKIDNLKDLYIQELRDIYSAETQITKAMPKIIKACSSPELQEAFQEHLEETKGQIERLDQILTDLDVKSKSKKCEAMEGILKEGEEILKMDADPSVRDAALISAAQKVEHYEICAYGTVRSYAKILGEEDALGLIEQTLEEEKNTDRELTKMAEKSVNKLALAA